MFEDDQQNTDSPKKSGDQSDSPESKKAISFVKNEEESLRKKSPNSQKDMSTNSEKTFQQEQIQSEDKLKNLRKVSSILFDLNDMQIPEKEELLFVDEAVQLKEFEDFIMING